MTPGIQQLMRESERLAGAFHAAVYVEGDVDAALAVLDTRATVRHLPAGTGAERDGLRRYLAEDVVPHRPVDLAFRRLSRTVDRFRVVDEAEVSFTHDRELPWLLPGVAATHRRAEVLAVTVVAVRQLRVTSVRTLWDHASLLAALGLDLGAVPLAADPEYADPQDALAHARGPA